MDRLLQVVVVAVGVLSLVAWWVVGMGLTIHWFGGSALLRWQWSDPVLFLVAGCLIWWVFIWIL